MMNKYFDKYIKLTSAISLCLGIASLSVSYAAERTNQAHLDPVSAAQIELGRYLFYDADLSKDGSMACASCHKQRHAFAEDNKTHPGFNGDHGIYNVPSLANVGMLKTYSWTNQHITDLAKHALVPITGTVPVEMGMHGQEKVIEQRIASNACYQRLFAKAYPDLKAPKITMTTITQAIARFEGSIKSFDSIWDKSQKTKQPLPSEMREGEKLFFGKGHCASCHLPPLFTDQKFYRIHDQITQDIRTPPLRNVELTAPYLHDGRAATIEEAIHVHDSKNTSVPVMDKQEITAITIFLKSLTDYTFINNPAYAMPKEDCIK